MEGKNIKVYKIAFTLIELLVVIAIIGILSGLIVVVMGGVTQKATIAKAQIFSNSLRNSLMMNLVSEWKLDQINYPTTNKTPDSWSGGNTGTINGSPSLQTTGCVNGNCLYFNGSTDYITGSLSGMSSIKRWTMSLWLRTTDTAGDIFDTRTSDLNGSIVQIYSSGNSLQFYVIGGSASVYKDYRYALNFFDNSWHYLTLMRNGDNSISLYFDGVLIIPTSKPTDADFSSVSETWSNFTFATRHSFNSDWTSGYFDEIRIFNAAMSTSQIKEQYYAGLNKLLSNGEIDKDEYQNKISENLAQSN